MSGHLSYSEDSADNSAAMNLSQESGITVDIEVASGSSPEFRLSPETAVVFNSKPNFRGLDYVRGISTIIGSSEIHSVFDDGKLCKVYLKDKKLVSAIIEAGVRVNGELVAAEYNIAPGTQVRLLDVDPILPNSSLECVLSVYGTLETPFICEKISIEEHFSHIEGSTRKVYMKIFNGKKLPSKIPVYHGGRLYEVGISTEPTEDLKRTSEIVDED